MKREAPSERELTDRIATAFERLPAPDSRRLAAIEEQFLAQTKSHGRSKIVWWWLVGALVAGGATATWWAVDYHSVQGEVQPVPAEMSPSSASSMADKPARSGRSEDTESTPDGKPPRNQGPVIYQRER